MPRIPQGALRVALLLAVSVLSTCQRSKTIDREEARSQIRLAASLASESLTFVTYVCDGRSTRDYAVGHTAYLQDEVRRTEEDLAKPSAAPDIAQAVGECTSQLKALHAALSGNPTAINDPASLAGIRKTIERIRENLTKANSLP